MMACPLAQFHRIPQSDTRPWLQNGSTDPSSLSAESYPDHAMTCVNCKRPDGGGREVDPTCPSGRPPRGCYRYFPNSLVLLSIPGSAERLSCVRGHREGHGPRKETIAVRKLIAAEHVTLDGVMEGPERWRVSPTTTRSWAAWSC